MRGPSISDCLIRNTASWGLYIADGANPGPLTYWGDYTRVRVDNPRSHGGIYVGAFNTTHYFVDCGSAGCIGNAAKIYSASGCVFERCTFEDSVNGGDDQPYILLLRAFAARVTDCWFEHHRNAFNTFFVELGDDDSGNAYNFCGNIEIQDCYFIQQNAQNANIVRAHRASHEVHIRNPRIAIPNVLSAPTGGVVVGDDCSVTLIGGEIATGNNYYDIGWVEGAGSRTYVLSRRRFRIPNLDASGEATLGQLTNGDFIFNSDIQQLKLHSAGKWNGVGTFYKSDSVGKTTSIASTALVDDPPAATYRITALLLTTAVGSTSDTVAVAIAWADSTGSYSRAFAARNLAVLGSQYDELVIRAVPGTPISYTATKAGTGGTYSLYMRAEQF